MMSMLWLLILVLSGCIYGFNFDPLLWWLVAVLLWGDIRHDRDCGKRGEL